MFQSYLFVHKLVVAVCTRREVRRHVYLKQNSESLLLYEEFKKVDRNDIFFNVLYTDFSSGKTCDKGTVGTIIIITIIIIIIIFNAYTAHFYQILNAHYHIYRKIKYGY